LYNGGNSAAIGLAAKRSESENLSEVRKIAIAYQRFCLVFQACRLCIFPIANSQSTVNQMC
jgi:hypothetical protein